MSPSIPESGPGSRSARREKLASHAPARAFHRQASARTASTFAALGDRTRLSLLLRLGRQAITKHLRVLERARIVRCVRSGRHSLFELDPAPVLDLRHYLDRVSTEWDQALGRLRSFVED